MVTISSDFNCSSHSECRGHRMNPLLTIDDVLEQVEADWRSGQPPNLRSLLQQLPDDTPHEDYAEAAIIDLQNRWKRGAPPCSTEEYAGMIPVRLRPAVAATILCHEFDLRNRLGDCPTRGDLCTQYPHLQSDFLRIVDHEIRETADWPVIVIQNGDSEVRVALDRPIRAGRQSEASHRPWSLVKGVLEHQLILCEMSSNKLSRQQLLLQLVKPDTVRVQNCSGNRALGVRGKPSLDAGQVAEYRMDRQIKIHLCDDHYLQIRKQAGEQSQ